MKRHFLLALSALMIMALLPQKANAGGNDYLEKEYHYQYDDQPYKVIEGNRCLGVAQFVDGLFYLYIINPNQEGGAEADNAEIHLKYYSAELKNIFASEEAITFLNDIQLGTVREPYTPKFIIAED